MSNLAIENLSGIESFTTLDLSSNTNLTYLSCTNNQLATLNVSAATTLYRLFCQNNELTRLDMIGLSGPTHFNATNNPTLSCISRNAGIGFYTYWFKDDSAIYTNDCNSLTKGGTMERSAETTIIKTPANSINTNNQAIKIYPNPASNRLYIALPEETVLQHITCKVGRWPQAKRKPCIFHI